MFMQLQAGNAIHIICVQTEQSLMKVQAVPAYSNWTYFKYSNAKLDMKETVYTGDKMPGQKYYYATGVALKTEKPISEEQAKEIRGKYTYEKLQFTPFVN